MASNRCPAEWPKTHNWVTRGQGAVSISSIDSALVGPLWRRCNRCGEEDRETPLCEAYYSYYVGAWPHYTTCGKRASVTHAEDPISHHRGKSPTDRTEFNYCKTHDPDAVEARRKASDARSAEKYAKASRERRLGYTGEEALKLLKEVREWTDANEDLVEADEWLAALARRLPETIRRMDVGG